MCTQTIPGVTLTNGVFHVKLDFDCTDSGTKPTRTLTKVLSQTPNGESVAIKITDVTHSKPYSYQALHALPFANVASQLVQMAAGDGQVLQWSDSAKAWVPGTITVSGGTVTNVSVSAPLTISNPASTPSITLAQANSTTDGYLSNTDWSIFNNKQPLITAGTTAQYYRGDKSWQTLNTDAVTEGLNLYFTNARVLGLPLTGFAASASAIVATDTVIQGFSKAQGQINSINSAANHFLVKDNSDSITGTVNVGVTGALTITNAPALPTDAANKQYVDTKLALTGGILSGALNLDSDLKIKGGSNYVTVRGHASSAAYNFILPSSAGTSGQFLQTDGSGNLSWVAQSSTATPSGAAGGDLAGTYPNPTIKTGLDTAKLSAGNVSNTEFDYLDGVTSAIQTQLNGKQATNANLSALSSYSTNGILVQTAANTFTGRSVQGTSNRVSVTNGNGVGGDPTIDIAAGLLPSPIAGDNGKVLKATGANTSAWSSLTSSDITTALTFTPVNKAGDSMTGDLSLGTSKLRFKDSASNYAELKAPTTVTTTYTLTLPADKAASNGQVLTGDTSGNLTWTTPSSTATPSGAAGGDLAGTYPNPTVKTGLDVAKLSSGVVDNTEFNYLDGVTNAIQTQLNGKQASDTTLSVLAIYNANGFVTQIAADTFTGRSITGTTNRVTVTNGNGVSGNPTIDIPTALLPSPLAGDANKFLKATAADTSAWTALASGDVTTALGFTPVNKTGDTMTGDLALTTKLRLRDSTTNYVELKAPTAVTAYTLTLPAAKATVAGQMLTSDTSGNLSWTTPPSSLAPTGAAGGELAGTYPNPTIANGLVATRISSGAVDNTEFDYLNGVTSAIQTQLDGKQSLNANLTALSSYSTNGILVQTAANTFAGRSIAGTANRITVTNGNGVSANPTIDIPTALLPSPVAGDAGKFLKASGANTAAWTAISSADIISYLGFTPMNKAGDSMTGAGTYDFTGTTLLRTNQTPVGLTDVTNKQYVDSFGQWTKSGSDIYRSGGNVGIVTSTPLTSLDVLSRQPAGAAHPNRAGIITRAEGTDVGGRVQAQFSGTTESPMYLGMRSRGTLAAPTAIQANDSITSVIGFGHDGSNYVGNGQGRVLIAAEQNWTVGSNPAFISFGTTQSGATTDSERMRITGSGNVGIGTTNPLSRFEVQKNFFGLSNTSAAFIGGTDSGLTNSGLYVMQKDANGLNSNTSYLMNAVVDGNSKMVVTGLGNVGIGTNTPSSILHLQSSSNTVANIYGADNSQSGINLGVGSLNRWLIYQDVAVNGRYLGIWRDHTGVAGNMGLVTAFTDAGNVGIGTATPANKLDVVGSFRAISSYAGFSDAAVLTHNAGGAYGQLEILNHSAFTDVSYLSMHSAGNTAYQFGIQGSSFVISNTAGTAKTYNDIERFTITNAGNIGIGTTAPSYKLDVNGSVNAAGGYAQVSDIRLKTNIEFLNSKNALEKITSLRGIYYDWKDQEKFGNEHQVGLIAQDVKKVFPEAIKQNNEGFFSVSYSNLVAPVIEAVKELYTRFKNVEAQTRQIASKADKTEIEGLKLENAQLKKDNLTIKKENAAIKAYLCSKDPSATICK